MTDLLPISELTVGDIEDAVRASLAQQPSLGQDALRDFVASVDWSTTDAGDTAVIDLLGELEDAATSVQEDPSSADEYIVRLMTLLPEDRLVSIFLDGIVFALMPGDIKLTAIPDPRPGSSRSAPRPRISLEALVPAPAL